MGTQFWWFYDILALSITAGILYSAISRGFNKIVFQLIGFLVAMAVGIYGSSLLKDFVYRTLFRENLTVTMQEQFDQEDWDVYAAAADNLLLTEEYADEPIDAASLRSTFTLAEEKGDAKLPEAMYAAVCNVVETAVTERQPSHAGQPLRELYASRPDAVVRLAGLLGSGDSLAAAQMVEEDLYRPSYLRLVRMALFLLIELLMLVIYGVIASVGGNFEEQMHVRRGNHLLAVPAGLIEAACLLLIFTVAVRLVVMLTDNEMLLFNQKTIDHTIFFRYLYRI